MDTSTQHEAHQPIEEPQPEAEQPIEQNDISPPSFHRSNSIHLPPGFYGFHMSIEGDVLSSDHTLVDMDDSSNYR